MLKFYFSILFMFSLIVCAQNHNTLNITNTGINMTVAILSVDSFIQLGDTIVALYKIDDINYKETDPYINPHDFNVAGLTVWEGERLAIAIWGNDSMSNNKDGFLYNEAINWAILKNNKYTPIRMVYKVGDNHWKPNGIFIVDSIKVDF